MTPAELRAARADLKLSGAAFARMVGAADGRSVRRWEAGDNDMPGAVVAMLRVLAWLPVEMRAEAVEMLLGQPASVSNSNSGSGVDSGATGGS